AHKGTSAQLSLAGRRLNLLPSATLDAKRQAMFDALNAAPDFDSLYRQQQLAVHQEALTLHRNYAARGTSPTLRPVAAAMVPVIERHLRLLRYLCTPCRRRSVNVRVTIGPNHIFAFACDSASHGKVYRPTFDR